MSNLRDPIYIAGPMSASGREDLNYPAFNECANVLRLLGYRVENPVINGDAGQKEWHEMMRMALRQLIRCHTIVLLPGWEKSRGATLEHHVAETLGMEMFEWSEVSTGWQLEPASPPAPARS